VLLAAAGGAQSHEALEWLCGTYWYPLYAFVRRQGYDAESARDLTQSFFVSLLEQSSLKKLDPSLGKFRAFLLASVKHFLSHERERESALKRRADDPSFRVNLEDAERRYALEPSPGLSPEELFESRWARAVLERALRRLKEECDSMGKGPLFRRLSGHLTGEEPDYESVARALETTTGALRVAVHRLRRRLGALLREEVAQTISEPDDLEDELRSLLKAAGRA
jgi:RNA polymerase sigma-70 factor (ECF subfamily)